MRIVPTEQTAIKLAARRLGRHIIRIKTADNAREFVFHEDALCYTSKRFRQKLQKNRKDLIGDCPICHDPLNLEVADIEFCRQRCGQNMHSKCVETWHAQQNGEPTCAMCREPWKSGPHKPNEWEGLEFVDQTAMEAYHDWIYRGTLRMPSHLNNTDGSLSIQLLKAWNLALLIRDKEFEHAIVAMYMSACSSMDHRAWLKTVRYAFSGHGCRTSIQNYILDCFVWLGAGTTTIIANHGRSFSARFYSQLVMRMMSTGQVQRDTQWMLTEHVGEGYRKEED